MANSAENRITLLVTGLSGAGKSTAFKALEDIGFSCIDNLPFPLLQNLVDKISEQSIRSTQIALFMDVRTDHFIAGYAAALEVLEKGGLAPEVIFLEANDETLIRRYSEMRRKHPLAAHGSVREGIAAERRLLAPLKNVAHTLIDTSNLNPHQLRGQLTKKYAGPTPEGALQVNILSFGFKHGLPAEADIVFDVRFLPNPHFVPELKDRTGKEPEVAAYALANEAGREFIAQLHNMIEFLVPLYKEEGKVYLTIAIGCTGGRHRSVATVEELVKFLKKKGLNITRYHRDLGRK